MRSIVPCNLFHALLIAMVLGIVACDPIAPGLTEQVDPWFDPPAVVDVEPEQIPESAHYPVADERLAEALEFLEDVSISQISPAEISYFAGRAIELPDVTRPYLVRGLYRSKRSHSISILGNALWVASKDDPKDATPMKRSPLVLIMDEVPERVYVSIGQ